jgi:hypothetical protein
MPPESQTTNRAAATQGGNEGLGHVDVMPFTSTSFFSFFLFFFFN